MRIWLDDIRPMPEGFTHHCKSAQEAMDLINANDVEEISFDYDLGKDEDGNEVSGYEVAKHIEAGAWFGVIKKMKWNIHSENPVGIENIKQVMTNADKYWKNNKQ